MRLAAVTASFAETPLERMLDELAAAGVEALELGTGNYPGAPHCRPEELLADDAALRRFADAVELRGLAIAALAQQGNPLHPDREAARAAHETWRASVRLAQRLGVEVVVAFAGCPGDGPDARAPNWVTVPWPPDYEELLAWQWRERVLPYWREETTFADEHGVRVAVELHPGFVVYSVPTLLRLREACGPALGATLDPSNVVWHGIDPARAVRELAEAGALFHVHAKDVAFEPPELELAGVLDTRPHGRPLERSWSFRAAGLGDPGQDGWRRIATTLLAAGYDGAVSIEHEDPLLAPADGVRASVGLLRPLLAA